MATISKAISANDVKNGAATIRQSSGVLSDSDSFANITNNDAVIDKTANTTMFDARFDDPRYYSGDAVT